MTDIMDGRMEQMAEMLLKHGPALVLTGAGCSTRSGIPDYRDRDGNWKHRRPVLFDDFVSHERVRQRYWAGSMLGWQRMERARPGLSHHSLAQLEKTGRVHTLITQNVDGLHQQAGSHNVIELHGRLANVICRECSGRFSRSSIQAELLQANREILHDAAAIAPDGDALVAEEDYSCFRIPTCPLCGGMLKPDVVFFGEAVPADRMNACFAAMNAAGCLLVAGSSLMVFSGYRYCRDAIRRGLPLMAINRGRTRADEILDLKIEADCGEALAELSSLLATPVTAGQAV